MSFSFHDKVILITGASSGIGRSAALEFAKRNAHTVILVARTHESLSKVKDEIKERYHKTQTAVFVCDVSDKYSVKDMAERVLESFDRIDVLVNNAGFAYFNSVNKQSIEDIEEQMKTNYFGMIYCTKYFIPLMLSRKSGHIVNVASLAASFGLPGIAPYCASKFAMLGFSEGLKTELKGTGVDVTVVSPIMVKTNFFDHPSFAKIKYSPMTLKPEDVAKAIVKASQSSTLEITVPRIARLAVWAKHSFPYLISSAVGTSFQRQLKKRDS